eukprot:GHVL01042780.1.p1 GENE.GHVL01042780.1~~GHVL01042780.1.p1  ORF type:complete len:156 (+),score=18.82 GHVL01042780.1:306-773(+)
MSYIERINKESSDKNRRYRRSISEKRRRNDNRRRFREIRIGGEANVRRRSRSLRRHSIPRRDSREDRRIGRNIKIQSLPRDHRGTDHRGTDHRGTDHRVNGEERRRIPKETGSWRHDAYEKLLTEPQILSAKRPIRFNIFEEKVSDVIKRSKDST